MNGHECTFAEEQEPSGRLILGPCLECGLPAMDAICQLREERDRLRDKLEEAKRIILDDGGHNRECCGAECGWCAAARKVVE